MDNNIRRIVCSKRNISKIGIGFILSFLLKARVLYLTILKWKNLSLPSRLKQTSLSFVWFYQCLSVKICCISLSDSEENHDGSDAESHFPLFFLFSVTFKNYSPREKVGKLPLLWDKWAESLFVFIIVTKYSIFPRADNGHSREKKKFWQSDLLMPSASTIGILSTLTYTEFDCVALLAMIY